MVGVWSDLDGGGVVGDEAGVQRGGVAPLVRGRPVPRQLGGREDVEVVVAGVEEEDGPRQQGVHRAGARRGDHLGLGGLEVPHLLRQRDGVARVLRSVDVT